MIGVRAIRVEATPAFVYCTAISDNDTPTKGPKKVPEAEVTIADLSENEEISFLISPRQRSMIRKPTTPANALICVASKGNINSSNEVAGGL